MSSSIDNVKVVKSAFAAVVRFLSDMSTLTIIVLAIGAGSIMWLAARAFISRSPLDKIPGPVSPSFFKGNLSQLLDRQGWGFRGILEAEYGKVIRLSGLFGHRMLYVFDPKALHQIVVKEPEVYNLPEWSTDIRLTLGPGLLGFPNGHHHSRQRKLLNPAFSIKHLRSMAPLFYVLTSKLRTGIEAEMGSSTEANIDILKWFTRVALELVGQGVLGYTLDPLDSTVPTAYGEAMKQFNVFFAMTVENQSLLKYVKYIGTPAFRAALIDWLPLPEMRMIKRLSYLLDSESRRIYEERKAALHIDGGDDFKEVKEGKDIISIILKANLAASEEDRLPDDEIFGQMSLLILAGIDTTSTALVKVMELLTEYPDIQDKLRAEIQRANEEHGEEIPYDTLVSLPYMDAVCRESLRLFPPASYLWREAQEDTVMPLSEPISCTDGTILHEIPVPAGTTIVIGVPSVNRSKDIWGDDALEFKPERWLSSLPSSLMEAHVPGAYSHLMTFNGGTRSCIGFKFSQLEMKVVLAIILTSFKIARADNANDIVWNIGGVRYPTLGKSSTKPAFPLKLQRLKV